MKSFRFVIGLMLVFNICSSFAYAAENCSIHLSTRNVPSGNYLRKRVAIPAVAEDAVHLKKVQASVKEITGKAFSKKTFDGAIDDVYTHLLNDASLDAIQKAEKLAKFGKSLTPVFEDMLSKVPARGTAQAPDLAAWAKRKEVLDKVKTVKYDLSRKLSKLEEFTYDEFVVVRKNDIVLSRGTNLEKLTHMKPKDYPKYIDSYLHYLKDPESAKGALYNKIDEGSLGILSLDDIRDITSYNVWPMYAKSHDIRHIHYSLTHPMALTAMMGTTRSKNPLRYSVMAGLYEGVDRVQYSHETALNNFFAERISADSVFGIRRNMDLEEAMLTVANATDEELKHIAQLSGVSMDSGWLFSSMPNWKPKRVNRGALTGHALDGETFEQELDNMVSQFSVLLERSEKIKAKLMANPDLVLSPQEEHFMRMMNFQIDPNSPEIVIEGLRYKNDGRAHSYEGDQDIINIGIGDQ